MSMADLMAKQDKKSIAVFRGQEIEGEVISINPQEVILDLGTKAEGVLQKKDLSSEQSEKLKVGDKLTTTVVYPENESGQVVLTLLRPSQKGGQQGAKWNRFFDAKEKGEALKGKALEVNKGGLIVEVGDVRGFLPSSQVALSQAANIEELVGKEVTVTVIEIDPNQNRLIFSQKTDITEEVKDKLSSLKSGQEVAGKVAAVLPFGVFVSLTGGVEGLVHISEMSWEKVEDPGSLVKVGDEVKAKVISTDHSTGRVNLSIKQLSSDPFTEKTKDMKEKGVVKGKVTKASSMGVFVDLGEGVEGLIHSSKLEDTAYEVGQEVSCLVDSIDTQKRRVNLVPFITSTSGLIYK